MKHFETLLLCFFISVQLFSQNCNTYDDKKFLNSLRFGKHVPADLLSCSGYNETAGSYASLRLQYDSLDDKCKRKFSKDFKFLSTPFSFLQLGVNKTGLLYSVELYSFFSDFRPDSLNYNPPAKFTTLEKGIESFLGKPNRIQRPTREDSLFIKELGMPLVMNWECNDISVRLRVIYGARNRDINIMHVQVVNHAFDVPEVEQVSQ